MPCTRSPAYAPVPAHLRMLDYMLLISLGIRTRMLDEFRVATASSSQAFALRCRLGADTTASQKTVPNSQPRHSTPWE